MILPLLNGIFESVSSYTDLHLYEVLICSHKVSFVSLPALLLILLWAFINDAVKKVILIAILLFSLT